MLQQQGSNNPGCMQTYFHDPEYQANYRATRNARTSLPARELELRTVIFRTLQDILTRDCNNPYLRSFLSINEFIVQQNLNPEELRIELRATERPPTGHHPGRYHVPTAPEVALLKDINPPAGSHRAVVCSVRQRSLTDSDRDDLTFFQDYH